MHLFTEWQHWSVQTSYSCKVHTPLSRSNLLWRTRKASRRSQADVTRICPKFNFPFRPIPKSRWQTPCPTEPCSQILAVASHLSLISFIFFDAPAWSGPDRLVEFCRNLKSLSKEKGVPFSLACSHFILTPEFYSDRPLLSELNPHTNQTMRSQMEKLQW